MIYLTLKLYEINITLGVVINKVVKTNGRKDFGP